MQTFPVNVSFQFQTSLAALLYLVQSGNVNFVLICVQFSPTSQTLIIYKQPSALPSKECVRETGHMQMHFILSKLLLGKDTSFKNPARDVLWYAEEEARRRCSLCRALPVYSSPAGQALHTEGKVEFTPLLSGRTADTAADWNGTADWYKSTFQMKCISTLFLKAPPWSSSALLST